MALHITWLGHASVRISSSSAVLYIDPWKTLKGPKADIILVTHDHYDHYSEEDIRLLSSADTRVVAPMSTGVVTDTISPGGSVDIAGVNIRAVPAYNLNKAFHPRANGWVGYVVEMDGLGLYHTGDTDRIPELKDLAVDVVFIPVGGTYTMDAKEASLAVGDVKARHAIPIHFGDIVGTRKDAQELSRLCTCKVHVLDPGQSVEIG
jgi:L-ascorbate metabolism protein UlaG (beta-lactamase superfamily)